MRAIKITLTLLSLVGLLSLAACTEPEDKVELNGQLSTQARGRLSIGSLGNTSAKQHLQLTNVELPSFTYEGQAVVAVSDTGQVLANGSIETDGGFSLSVATDQPFALMHAEQDAQGTWLCLQPLEYQTLVDNRTEETQPAFFNFSSFSSSASAELGTFSFNELSGHPASNRRVAPEALLPKDQSAFADTSYQNCGNEQLVQAPLDITLPLKPFAGDTEPADLYDLGVALALQQEADGSYRIVGAAPVGDGGQISMKVSKLRGKERNIVLMITDVSTFDKNKLTALPTPTFNLRALVASRNAPIALNDEGNNLGEIPVGIAYLKGQVSGGVGQPVGNAKIVGELGGNGAVSFNVTQSNADGRYEMLLPVNSNNSYLLTARSEDEGLVGTLETTLDEPRTYTDQDADIKPEEPDNQPPVAFFTASPESGKAPLPVQFDASGSSDPDGSIVNYSWDFDDGSTDNGETVTHTFEKESTYAVKLTVTDDDGASDTETHDIKVSDDDDDDADIYALELTIAGNGSGTVTMKPNNVSCTEDCSKPYVESTAVTLSATPDVSANFASWDGACSGTVATCTVTMDTDKLVTARFAKEQFTLTLKINGEGDEGGRIVSAVPDDNGDSVDCADECPYTYDSGTDVTLRAEGDGFEGWKDDSCDSKSGDKCTITMTRDRRVEARFDD